MRKRCSNTCTLHNWKHNRYCFWHLLFFIIMLPKVLIFIKICLTILLGMGAFSSIILTIISLPVGSTTTTLWAGIFALSSLFFLAGIVLCWRYSGISRMTLAAIFYGAFLYVYINWFAPQIPEPFGYGFDTETYLHNNPHD